MGTTYFLPNESISYFDFLTYDVKPYSSHETHSHYDEFEIYWFLQGELFFSFEGIKIDITPGDMVIICDQQLHRPIIKKLCTYHRKRILFKSELFDSIEKNGYMLRNLLRKNKIIHLNREEIESAQLDKAFSDIERWISSGTPYDQFCTSVGIFSFLIKANELAKTNVSKQAQVHVGKAYDIIKYINENLASDLSYKTLAEKFFISEKNLYNFFKRETGFPLSKYITKLRIIRAKEILSTGGSAFDAATAAGYDDYSVFYRNFVKETGITPAKYAQKRYMT